MLWGEEVGAVDGVQDNHQPNPAVLGEDAFVLIEHIPDGDFAEIAHIAEIYEHGSKMAVYFLLSDRGEIGLDAEGVVFWKLLPLDLV